jgi:hypothetical protein
MALLAHLQTSTWMLRGQKPGDEQGQQGDPTRLNTTMLAFDALKDHGTEKTRVHQYQRCHCQGRTGSWEESPVDRPRKETSRKVFFQPIRQRFLQYEWLHRATIRCTRLNMLRG